MPSLMKSPKSLLSTTSTYAMAVSTVGRPNCKMLPFVAWHWKRTMKPVRGNLFWSISMVNFGESTTCEKRSMNILWPARRTSSWISCWKKFTKSLTNPKNRTSLGTLTPWEQSSSCHRQYKKRTTTSGKNRLKLPY